MKRKILIVEDEQPILLGLVDLFTFHGYDVDSATDGDDGLNKALTGRYDLIILDVMLPGKDGFAVCNDFRAKDRSTPVVMLTAKTSEDDIIAGLSLGADDYVAKPFSVRALVLRVEAILRRTLGDSDNERFIKLGEKLTVDTINLRSEKIEFTKREIELLRYLLKAGDRPINRAELLTEIWGYQRATEIETRTVDIHIAKLRKKIENDPREPEFLLTIRGEGYKLMQASFAGTE